MSHHRTRIGIMGFGQLGRQLFRLASACDDLDIVAVADTSPAEVLHYLLVSESKPAFDCELAGNHLVAEGRRSRLLRCGDPAAIPWDSLGADWVVDASKAFRTPQALIAHCHNGAERVLLASLPDTPLDGMFIPGANTEALCPEHRLISAGSATTTALALGLQIVARLGDIEAAGMTAVHAISSDQPGQDHAGSDCRRSRSAASNIIPNDNISAQWVEAALPQFSGRLSGQAINVPVQRGSMLDLNVVMSGPTPDRDAIAEALLDAAASHPGLIASSRDPIVSSDDIGRPQSAIFDLHSLLKSGRRMLKTLVWYDELSHAGRLLELIRHSASAASGRPEPAQ